MRKVIFTLIILWPVFTQAQDRLGAALSNYSPSTTLFINPSSIADSKAWLDIHLVGAGVSVHNNFAYLPGESFQWSMLWKNPESVPEPGFRRGFSPYYAHASVFVQGPGLSIVVGRNAFALNTALRSFTDARGLPGHLANYMVEGFQWSEQMGERYTATNMRVGSLSYAQIGLTYSRMIKVEQNSIWSAGITVNRLIGIAGAGVLIDEWEYSVRDSLNLDTYRVDGSYGVNEPAFNSGGGWGVDIGMTFKRTRKPVDGYMPHSPRQGCQSSDYLDKLGVSILDLGRVNFEPVFYSGTLTAADTVVWEDYSSADPEDLEEIIGLIDDEINGQASSDQQGPGKSFRVALPAAVSVQYDRWIRGPLYLGGVLVQGFPRTQRFGPQRLSQLAFVPRLEFKRFEMSMPLLIRNFKEPAIGLMFRFNSIIVGTDRLGSLIKGNRDVYGTDLYFHIKYTIFNKSACKGRSTRGRLVKSGKRSGRVPPCPSW